MIGGDTSRGAYNDLARALPLDLVQLSRSTQGDPAFEREILELFLDHARTSIERLRHAASDADWIFAAHALKGCGRAVGAWRIARLAETAERRGMAGQRGRWTSTVDEIEAATVEARRFIEERIENGLA